MIEDDAKKALLKLFQCFNVTGSDTERKIKFTAYWEVLADLPANIIVSACRKAGRGEVGNKGFLPTAAELYQAAIQMLPRRITPLIEEYISPKERDAAATLIRGLARDLKMFRDVEKPLDPDHENVDIEAYLIAKYRDKPWPQLSAELRAKLGVAIPEITE